MVVKRFSQSFDLLRPIPVLMACVFMLSLGGGRAADAASPATEQSSGVPPQAYSPPGYPPARPGNEYVPNPQHNNYHTYDYNYGGPTYVQQKAKAPYVDPINGQLLDEWQYSGGYHGALNRGEIQYQPGDNRQTAPPTPVRGH